MTDDLKPVGWIASSFKDIKTFPVEVQKEFGFALFEAQKGGKHPDAKPLKWFSEAGVLEVVENHDGDTFRAVYTVRFIEAVYVLHCFQKKSKSGIATPKQDIDLIKSRLRDAEERHKEWLKNQK